MRIKTRGHMSVMLLSVVTRNTPFCRPGGGNGRLRAWLCKELCFQAQANFLKPLNQLTVREGQGYIEPVCWKTIFLHGFYKQKNSVPRTVD